MVCTITEQPFRLAQGGAIHSLGGTVTVEHSFFEHNKAVSVAQWPWLIHVLDVRGIL